MWYVVHRNKFHSILFLQLLQGEKNQWQMRRSQKVDKQEILTLQSNLHAEIQAKQQLMEELNKMKAANVANERWAEMMLSKYDSQLGKS